MVLCTSRIRWFGQVERSTGLIAVVARKRHGKPKKTLDEVLVDDKEAWNGVC